MQSSRLFRRNNHNIFGLLPQRLWLYRSYRLSSLRHQTVEESKCDSVGNSSSDDSIKVTVVGAAGRVGRTLSLLLKTSPLVDQLCMFDIDKSVKGFCMDISHIDTKCCVSHVNGMENIQEALDDPDVVVIAAGIPMSPEINTKQLFRKNAPIVAGLSEAFAKFCPEACLVLITNPINSLLPVAGEVFQLITGEKPTSRLFGLTTLDVVRANTFTAEAVRRDPSRVIVPVIGGTSQDTIVPVISQMKPCCKIKHEEIIALTECLKHAEGNLTDCQNCGTKGSSSLSTAYAAFRFTSSLISALKGEQDIIECAYVQSDILPELEYMASPIKLGVCGMEYNYGYPRLSDYEVSLMERAAPVLQRDINLGKAYVIEVRGKHYEKLCGLKTYEDTGLAVAPSFASLMSSEDERNISTEESKNSQCVFKSYTSETDATKEVQDSVKLRCTEKLTGGIERREDRPQIIHDSLLNCHLWKTADSRTRIRTRKAFAQPRKLTTNLGIAPPGMVAFRTCCLKKMTKEPYVKTDPV